MVGNVVSSIRSRFDLWHALNEWRGGYAVSWRFGLLGRGIAVGIVGGKRGDDWENYRFKGVDSKIGMNWEDVDVV